MHETGLDNYTEASAKRKLKREMSLMSSGWMGLEPGHGAEVAWVGRKTGSEAGGKNSCTNQVRQSLFQAGKGEGTKRTT